jgi:type 1 fimbriae regulatory protein FimB/type 1 fimbriae regulatory protein FimE
MPTPTSENRTVVRLRPAPRRPVYADVRQREHLTEAEVERIRAAARKRGRYGHRDDTMILIAFRHGLRVSELVSLRWSQVALNDGKLHIRRAKGGDSGVHPIGGAEIRALRRLRREQSPTSPYVFTTERNGPCTGTGFAKMLTRAAEAAGLGELRVHPHMLRHSAGYELAERRTDLRVIQQYLGHKAVTSTTRYVALSSSRFDGIWND